MKKIFFFLPGAVLVLSAIFYSCSKSATDQNVQPETTLKFKVNGTVYEWKNKGFCGLYCGTSLTKLSDRYELQSFGNGQNFNTLKITIPSANLAVTTYNVYVNSPLTSGNALLFVHAGEATLYNEITAASTETGDFVNITITSIHNTGGNNYADGIFSARLTQSPYGIGAPKADITEGEFYNVIIYQ